MVERLPAKAASNLCHALSHPRAETLALVLSLSRLAVSLDVRGPEDTRYSFFALSRRRYSKSPRQLFRPSNTPLATPPPRKLTWVKVKAYLSSASVEWCYYFNSLHQGDHGFTQVCLSRLRAFVKQNRILAELCMRMNLGPKRKVGFGTGASFKRDYATTAGRILSQVGVWAKREAMKCLKLNVEKCDYMISSITVRKGP